MVTCYSTSSSVTRLVIPGCPLAEQMSLSLPAVLAPQRVACGDGLDPQPVCLVGQQSDCAAFGGTKRGASGSLSVSLADAVLTFCGAEAGVGTVEHLMQAGPPQGTRGDAHSALPQHPPAAF